MTNSPSLQEIINAITNLYQQANSTVIQTTSVPTPASSDNKLDSKIKEALAARRRFWQQKMKSK